MFDTVATEAQRQLYENFSMFVRNFLPKFPPPDADSIDNLSMAVVVDQKRLGGGSTSTVGTVTDIFTVLRLLFSRLGVPNAGGANSYSFNDPSGRCPECNGLGRALSFDTTGWWDLDLSLGEGALTVPLFVAWENNSFTSSGFFDNAKKLRDYDEQEMHLLLWGSGRKFKMQVGDQTMNATYEGVLEKVTRQYIRRDLKTLGERTQKSVGRYLSMAVCPLCHGARLNQAVLASRIAGRNISELANTEIGELVQVLRSWNLDGDPVAAPMLSTLLERLGHLVDIGLDYLSLSRETDTLSGGESQRVKMVKHLSSSLIDTMYIFDEPSVGLHPRDVHRLGELLGRLRDKGNTVIVVEHDPDVIKVADHVVDVGPRAGRDGGRIMYEGSYAGLLESDTLTGRFLGQHLPLKATVRSATGWLPVRGATVNNLRDVSVDIPTGVLTAVTGVAGSGKSSLIHQVFLQQHPDAVVIDQSAVGASSRSNPGTYTGVMDDIRRAFAKANKVNAGLFSFNSTGACPDCRGHGVIWTDLAFMDGVKTLCETCQGKRFRDDVLEYRLDGVNIDDVLEMTVAGALDHFHQKDILRKFQAISDVGLDYLTIGQPLSTLSGGECQRIKLAGQLHKKGSIYVMDEPTTGLHLSDVENLLVLINRLVDTGNTVIVIEHQLDVIRQADWVIDMGPEGGHKGGQVLFEGPPADLLGSELSLTARYL